jgi:hypothetical protein
MTWKPHWQGAREGLTIFFLSLVLPPWERDSAIHQLAEKAYRQEYSGYWTELQYFMENCSTLEQFLEIVELNRLADEFYGNFLDLTEKVLRRNRFAFKRVLTKGSKPKYPQRRRGYRDKGSLRPYHQRGRNIGDSIEPIDRREATYDSQFSLDGRKENIPTMKSWAAQHIPNLGKEDKDDVDNGGNVEVKDYNANRQTSALSQQAQEPEPLSLGSLTKEISPGPGDQAARKSSSKEQVRLSEVTERDYSGLSPKSLRASLTGTIDNPERECQ